MRALLLALPATVFLISPAAAQLEVCNSGSVRASVAIGYKGDADWTSEGWWRVEPGECRTVIKDELSLTHYYWRATTAAGPDWPSANYMFCVSSDAFTIVGDDDCDTRGHTREGFNEIELTRGTTGFRLTLNDEDRLAALRAAEEAVLAAEAPAAPSADDKAGRSDSGTTVAATTTEPTTEPLAPAAAFTAKDGVFQVTNPIAPGFMGEPYTITGKFAGCGYNDISMYCELRTADYTYRATSDDATPWDMLDAMFLVPEGTEMIWRGDLMSSWNGVAEVTLREAVQTQPDPFAQLRADLQGNWKVEGEWQSVFISGSRYTMTLEGELYETGILSLQDSCPDSLAPGDPHVMLLSDPDASNVQHTLCWAVIEVTGGRAEFFPVGAMREIVWVRDE